ncbi:MAG: PAS domain S-box protein [Geobacteraceae bacterium]|nr:PAS domain S-box protein [Geobacteraceae bacterium]
MTYGKKTRNELLADNEELRRRLEEAELRLQAAEERERAPESLWKSEAMLRMAQETGRIGIWQWHPATGEIQWTPELAAIYGLEPGSIHTYNDFTDRVHPDDIEKVEEQRDQATKERKTFRLEYRIQQTDGETRWVFCQGAAHYDSTGKPSRIFGVNIDITERKQAEAALERINTDLERRVAEQTAEIRRGYEAVRAERQRLYDVLETLPVYVILLTPDYHVPFANRFFRDRFGEDHGKRCFEYLFGRGEPCENCESYTVLKTNAPHRWEWTCPHGRNYDIYDFPFIDSDGSPLVMEMGIDITEIKRADAAVKAERQRLYDVLEALPVMIGLLTPDYHVSFSNKSFRDKFGESHGRRCYEYCFGKPEPCDFCESFTVLKTGIPHQWELTAPDGSVIAAHDYPFTDCDGSPLILEMDIDITDHRRAEAALRELNATLEQRVIQRTAELRQSEERFRAIASSTPDHIAVMDRELRYTYVVNPQLGLAEEDVVGKTDFDILSKEDAEKLAAIKRRIIDTGEPMEMEASLNDAEGKLQCFEGSFIPSFDEDNRTTGLIGYFKNITERKLAQTELERMRIILSEGQRIAHVGSFEYLAETRTTVWSEEEYRIYGLDPAGPSPAYDELLAKIIHPDDADLLHRTFTAAMQSGSIYELEHRIVHPDGKMRWVHERAKPYFDEQGKLVNCIGATLDITERKQAEEALGKAHEELERKVEERTQELAKAVTALRNEISERGKIEQQLLQAQKMESIGLLAGGVAHDFNNLLTGISGYAQFLQDSIPEDEELRESVEQILAAADRAAELTGSLLAFSRKQAMKQKPALIDGIIYNAGKFIQRVIGEDIEFCISHAGRELLVMVDSGQIEQVLMNLAINARDAMPKGGSLTITTRMVAVKEGSESLYDLPRPGEYAHISFADTGTGIDETAIERIFEPFYSTKEVGKGTGLGLSIVHGIIKQHDGSILVSSTPGKGTTFDFYLPLIENCVVTEDVKPSGAVRGGTETLLVAEDEELVATYLKKTLEKAGYRVIMARDGIEAVARLREREGISLVLSDLVMPGKNGMEVSSEIRDGWPGTRIILISGYAPEIMCGKGLVAEGVDVLSKPFSNRELLLKVRQMLDRS